MYDSILRYIIYPITQFATAKPTLTVLREIERIQWWPVDRVRAFQWKRLKAILEHAYKHTSYYRRAFDASGLRPVDIRTPDDLAHLPILAKTDIRQHIDELKAVDRPRPVRWRKTGGSTGEPLSYPLDRLTLAYGAANAFRCRRWWGVEIGDRTAQFWRDFYDFYSVEKDRLQRRRKNLLMNRRVFSVYDMSLQNMSRYYQELISFRPKVIVGYASALFAFARFVREEGLSCEGVGVKAVVATAEAIFPAQVQLIQDAFGCPVVSEYGAAEVGILAYSCPGGAWHTMDESVWLEVVPVEDENRWGEILVTSLVNYAYPMIRYRVGDLADLEPTKCSCGRGLGAIGPVRGRSHDLIVTPEGRFIHGEFFVHIFDTIGRVRQFRVIQDSLERLRIEYVCPDGLSADGERFLREQIGKFMGKEVAVDLQRVETLPTEHSGKLRFIVSDIAEAKLERSNCLEHPLGLSKSCR